MKTQAKTLILTAMFLPIFGNTNDGEKLATIDPARRALHAQHILGEQEFKRLADFSGDEISLEKVVLEKVSRAKRRLTRVQLRALANTIIRDANKYGLDPLYVVAIIEQESRFNPSAKGSAGEIGLMQIMPKTAAWVAKKYKLTYSAKNQLYDPVINVKIGIRFLDLLNRRFNDARHSTAAYNMGVKNVKRILASNKQPEIYHSAVLARYKRIYAQSALKVQPAPASRGPASYVATLN